MTVHYAILWSGKQREVHSSFCGQKRDFHRVHYPVLPYKQIAVYNQSKEVTVRQCTDSKLLKRQLTISFRSNYVLLSHCN